MSSITDTGPKMVRSKSKEQKIVYRLTKNTNMKFRPENNGNDIQASSLIQRIKSLTKFIPFTKKQGGVNSTKQSKEQGSSRSSRLALSHEPLKFLFRLDSESYLVGNSLQLDAINLITVEDYIQTQHLWSLKLKGAILHVLVDDRRRVIVIIVKGEIVIYGYQGKKSKIVPKIIKSFRILDQVKMLQMVKDSLLAVYFQKSVFFFIIDGMNSRQNTKKDFNIDKSYTFFQPSPCIQNSLNVFFRKSKQKQQDIFELWALQIQIQTAGIQLSEIKKVYEINESFANSIKIQSIAKDCYFINVGPSILMFKKGYLIDKVYINIQVQNSLLKYFGDKKLIHVAPSQIDFYNVIIDLVSNPPKLAIKSTDSIGLELENCKYRFLEAIKFDQHKIGFFYQLEVPSVNGEVKYYFSLTQKWDFQEKVRSILPNVSGYKLQNYSQLIGKIQACCDAVGKMGVTRKQAYLRIWRDSNKQSVQQFKLLLDTHDYNTIRQQILLKLKKKSMGFVQVHKIQQGCLGMISENVFSSKKFTLDEFKNYIISHYLIRKLQLFKQIKLYQKSTGKLKLTDSQIRAKDKNLVNIQEYTNIIKMDIKAYLLELVHAYARKKVDKSTQIRIVIRKFKFAFRYIYLQLMKDIVATAKQDLLFLLQNIPELLPYVHNFQIFPQDPTLFNGVWGQLKYQEWQQSLFLDNVVTVYSKQAIIDFGNNVWVKRNWLTYHDMIFLNRLRINQEFQKIKGEFMFYPLVQHIFQHYSCHQKMVDLINYLQDNYVEFPPHLFNNVFLYRNLYLYFQSNNVMTESFQQYLRKKDQEIFKKIFDHQKFKKGSFLKEIKPIFQNLKQSDKFNFGLLKFFSSNLSQVSDIKYLLNRINNQKKQFHDENEEMYEVLIKGMQIKLKLGSARDIPISQVLIYMLSLPLDKSPTVKRELRTLQQINEQGEKFKRIKLDMSVFQIIRNRDSVLMSVISYDIEESGIRLNRESEYIVMKSKSIIREVSKIRQKIYGEFQDNIILFMFLIKLLQTVEMVPFVTAVIQENVTDNMFGLGQLQSVVFYCYRQRMMNNPKYSENIGYIFDIMMLLPEDNCLRKFVEAEFALAHCFELDGKQILFPISGQTGLVSMVELEGLIENLSKQGLLAIDIELVYELSRNMQLLLTGESLMSLYDLYQILIMSILNKKQLKQAILKIQKMFALDPTNINNPIYPMLIFKNISCQFTQQNKQLMMTIISSLFQQPAELVKIFNTLFATSYSNQEQKILLTENIANLCQQPQNRFNSNNILFDDISLSYLSQFPQKRQAFSLLLQQQLQHLLRSQEQFMKSTDMMIFHIISVHDPRVLIKYLHLNRYLINLKQLRAFISYFSKYELFDQTKVLQFGKRMFKALYDQMRDGRRIDQIILDIFSTTLVQTTNIDVLPADTDNLNRIVKSIQKLKSKLKVKMNASKKKIAIRNTSDFKDVQYAKLQEYLQDPTKYLSISYDYPFNDSDNNVERGDYLVHLKFKQGGEPQCFSFKKYLTWLFARTNQAIQYYFLKGNEAEADQALKKQQQALRLSFRKTSNDKVNKDNAALICNTFSKTIKQNAINSDNPLGFLPISAIPNVTSSIMSVDAIWAQQVEQIHLGTTMLKDEIMLSLIKTNEKTTIDLQLIQNYGTTSQIEAAIPSLIRQIYEDCNIEVSAALQVIRIIYDRFSKITPINTEFLDIYIKIEQLQKKLSLDFDTRILLPFNGLLIRQKDNGLLFNFIKDSIRPYLNQNNIHTLSRMLEVAFKKTQFQQEMKNQFFRIIVKEFHDIQFNSFDQNMKLQKIAAFASKMPINHLKVEMERLITEMDQSEKINQIVKLVCDILRSRNDGKNAQLLYKRWLNPQMKITE